MSSIKDKYSNFVSDKVVDNLIKHIELLEECMSRFLSSDPYSPLYSIYANKLIDMSCYLNNIQAMYEELHDINIENKNKTEIIKFQIAINRLAIYESKILEELKWCDSN